ncbi:MAG: helix-turn-helix transcriptional regulator [Myxococcota bacterium]
MDSASLICEARLRAGLTQAQLAQRASTTQSAVARWESGGSRPSLETLERLIEACGLELRLQLTGRSADEASLIERNLVLSPSERLDQLVRTVEFIRTGQAALERARG